MASDLLTRLPEVVKDLEGERVRYALVGGFALLAHGVDRPRKDIDFAVSVRDDSAAEKVVVALRGRGYLPLQAFEHSTTGQLVGVRFLLPRSRSQEPECDLLFGTSGVEGETVSDAKTMKFAEKTKLRVASRGHLMALKVLADRQQDRRDLVALLAKAGAQEKEEAMRVLELMNERGHAPERDLLAAWRTAVPAALKLTRPPL